MLKEALEALMSIGHQLAIPVPLDLNDARHKYFAFREDIAAVDLPKPPRDHKVECLEDLIELAKRFDPVGGDGGPTPPHNPVVWYNADKVVLVIDDDGHRIETATLNLVKSDVFIAVIGLAFNKNWFVHKDFVRLLKINLVGTLPPEALLNVVKRIKFENGAVTTAEIRKNRESMGREIIGAVSAEGEIPDTVTLAVPVYKTFGLREARPVRCTVEVDAMEGKFRLMPFPDEIEQTLHLALAEIATELEMGLPDSVPAYMGTP